MGDVDGIAAARDVVVIYNARSSALASRSGQPTEERLTELFTRRGVTPTLRSFDPATVREDVDVLLAARPDAVVVAGGDGTVMTVARHLLGADVPLGVLPAGTRNVLARDLGVPLEWDAALDAVLAAPIHLIDVARVNDQAFLCSSALAMMPHLGRVRENARGVTGWSLLKSWIRGVRIWRRYPRMRLRVVVDGQEHLVRTRALVVTNNPLSFSSMSLPGRDRLDTGHLAVYVTRGRAHRELFGIAPRLVNGGWRADKLLDAYEGRTVEVSSPRLGMMSVMSDGELDQLETPLRYDIQPRRLAVLAPR